MQSLKIIWMDFDKGFCRKNKKISFHELHENSSSDEAFAISPRELMRLLSTCADEPNDDGMIEIIDTNNTDTLKFVLNSPCIDVPIYLNYKEATKFAMSLYAYINFAIQQHISDLKAQNTEEDYIWLTSRNAETNPAN